MRSYRAEITINAAPDKVWAILVDTASYQEWDPGMERVEGRIESGASVKFFAKLSSDQAFPVRVTALAAPEKMVLTGGMPLGLFKSERTHTLIDNGQGGSNFVTEEVFSGLLLPLFGKNIPDLNPIFQNFAEGLKKRSEM